MELTLALTKLLKKKYELKWTNEAEQAFVDMKSQLVFPHILGPQISIKLFIWLPQFCVRACLLQVIG